VEHPGVVRILGAELGGERPHIVLAHAAGPRLSSLVRRAGPLPSSRLRALGHGLAAAAAHLAGRGIAHLDVKPSNVIMSERPVLIDLSVARPLAACSALRTHVGTDAYMAPEQCAPPELGAPGPASDVWGIGGTLLWAAAGARPFRRGERESEVPSERWPQLIEGHAPLPRDLDPAVAAAIGGCLQHDPAARPSATELEAMLAPTAGRGTA
jgi:serine/threonine protein kinase